MTADDDAAAREIAIGHSETTIIENKFCSTKFMNGTEFVRSSGALRSQTDIVSEANLVIR